MERSEVVARAAAILRAAYPTDDHPAGRLGTSAGALVARICAALDLELQSAPRGDVMLGGAYSRLHLWQWGDPAHGGMIWLRDDLDSETRAFAIAHELGHYALHRGEGISLHPACDERQVDERADPADLRTPDHQVEEYSTRTRRELEANAFAAALLAPAAEVRRLFTTRPDVDADRLAAHFGISRVLARRRLVDAVLAPQQAAADQGAPAPARDEAPQPTPADLIAKLDDGQREAARAPGPALVVAGPGTGKTATLVGRVAYLVGERHVPPERVLALTFSNRAAGEMRDRLARSGLPGERMPIMTIHAFAATLLRGYPSSAPHAPDEPALRPDFRIVDEVDAYLLMEELLDALPLRHYRSLGNPTAHLRALLADCSRARDGLLTPADYLAMVEAMLPAPGADSDAGAGEAPAGARRERRGRSQPPAGTYTPEQIAKARERARAYAVWDRELRRRGLVDFGGLIQRTVELLRADPAALAEVRARYPEILVDEFQDTNRAAAELLVLLAGAAGSSLWVVGDRNQSIYRFRGASPATLPRLVAQYPALRVRTLRRCYRSVPDIVRLGSVMAARMAVLSPAAATDTAADDGAADGDAPAGALDEALRPLALEPVRPAGEHLAIRRGDAFATAAHERLGLAEAIRQHRALGYTYGDQAVLCRTHRPFSVALTSRYAGSPRPSPPRASQSASSAISSIARRPRTP
jgi:Zn-dependent peptidase ImmA (M78 family)